MKKMVKRKHKFNLDETWKLCLSQWRWIAKEIKKDPNSGVWVLKAKWVNEHGYDVKYDCFFCEYSGRRNDSCYLCPGTQIDPEFNCEDVEYHYANKPIAFYNKLVSLNRKRLKAKKK